MKSKPLIALLSISLLINATVIPVLYWKLLGWQGMYRRNVDYAAELAYAVGFHRAKGHDLAVELEDFPTRLQITKITPRGVDAVIWPARNQSIYIEFGETEICNISIAD
jgi:hypothetical protein